MTYIPENLRRRVAERAAYRCEYCLVHQDDVLYTHEIDHIIPTKHRGETVPENLCLSCLDCNRSKGSDFASFDPETAQIVRLFNPRQQRWLDHFRLDGAFITSLSLVGQVTIFLLKFNSPRRLRSRQALRYAGRYPP